MNNNIGKFNGAESIQRMRAQQQNAPQVEGQEQETSETVRKPLSKSEVVGMMKDKVGEPTSNVNTGNVTTQEVQGADHNEEEPPKLYTQYSNTDDLRNHGKPGDFVLSVIVGPDGLGYVINYLRADGEIWGYSLTEDEFNNLKDFNGEFFNY